MRVHTRPERAYSLLERAHRRLENVYTRTKRPYTNTRQNEGQNGPIAVQSLIEIPQQDKDERVVVLRKPMIPNFRVFGHLVTS